VQVSCDVGGLRAQDRHQIVVTADDPQAVGEGPQRLVVQRHRPGAGHRAGHRGVGGLQRVVPVAVAVCDEPGAGQCVGAGPVQRPLQVGAHGRGGRGRFVGRGVPARRLLEQRCVTGRQEVPAEGQDGPVHHVAVGRLHPEVLVPGQESERLWPGAVGVLRGEDRQQQVTGVLLPVEGEEQLERTLDHVAGAPGAAGELLEATGREEVHEGVADQPGQAHGEGVDIVVGHPECCHVGPPCGSRARARARRRPPGRAGRFRRAVADVVVRVLDLQLHRDCRCRRGDQRDDGRAASAAVVEELSVVPERDGLFGPHHQLGPAAMCAPAQPHDVVGALFCAGGVPGGDVARGGQRVGLGCKVQGQQDAPSGAFGEAYPQLDAVSRRGCHRRELDGTARVGPVGSDDVDPPRGVRRHREHGRQVEQPPSAVDLDEDA